jgi:hypothetical protein
MLCGRSQRNENLQGDECILQQISALRRENRFLKVGLIFCLVLAALFSLAGFQSQGVGAKGDIYQEISALRGQIYLLWFLCLLFGVFLFRYYFTVIEPKSVRTKRVMVERIEFIRGNETVVSITAHPVKDGVVIWDKNGFPVVWLGVGENGGIVGIINNDHELVTAIGSQPFGGIVCVYNNDGNIVAAMVANPSGGAIGVGNEDGITGVAMGVTVDGGYIWVNDNETNSVASMSATPQGGKIELKTPSGRTVWSAP